MCFGHPIFTFHRRACLQLLNGPERHVWLLVIFSRHHLFKLCQIKHYTASSVGGVSTAIQSLMCRQGAESRWLRLDIRWLLLHELRSKHALVLWSLCNLMFNIIQYIKVGLLLTYITGHGLLNRASLIVEAVRHHHHIRDSLGGLRRLHPVLQLRLVMILLIVVVMLDLGNGNILDDHSNDLVLKLLVGFITHLSWRNGGLWNHLGIQVLALCNHRPLI